MGDKVQINIVYGPGEGPPSKVYENEKGVVWHSNKKDPQKINIGMGWYSIPKPTKGDCLLAIEPYCILERDYDPNFGRSFRHIFTWTPGVYQHPVVKNRTIKIKHPCWHQKPNIEELSKDWLSWDERRDEVVFIANNKTAKHDSELYSLRVQLADLLYNKSSFKVSWYGQIKLKRPYYKGPLDSKHDILSKAKFSVCTENSYDPLYTQNYFSEKMPEVWKSGCVPIYMGCYNIDDFGFFEHSYIDLRKYVKKKGKVHSVDYKPLFARLDGFGATRYEEWSQNVKNSLFRNDKLFNLVAYSELYETIINTLAK